MAKKHQSAPRDHSEIPGGIGVGYGINWTSARKIGDISETVQEKLTVSIECYIRRHTI